MQNKKDYIIGLDIGTASVGYAVIDLNSKLLKKDGQYLWGYDKFEEASTAKNRRLHRSARRMISRRKQRIHLLQDMCSEMLYQTDNNFYHRLKNSFLVKEDRKDGIPECGLFYEENGDAEFYKKYPTIYHLRKELVENKEKADPRFVYLALHHIVKYRGNFRYEGQNISDITNVDNIRNELLDLINSIAIDNDEELQVEDICNVILDESSPRKDRIKKVSSFAPTKEIGKILTSISNSIFGYKFVYSLITNSESSDKISFKDATIDEEFEKIENDCGEKVEYLYTLREIYNAILIKDIIRHSDKMMLSDNMVNIYNNHKNDLKDLKDILKNNKEVKEKILSNNGLYEKYIKNYSDKDFDNSYKKPLIKELNKLERSDKLDRIINSIEDGMFANIQNTTDNSAIPYQLHLIELEKILDNQSKYYPCLEKNKQNIMKLVSTRLPYYVGPLTNDKTKEKQFAWVQRNDRKGNINYINWEEYVDKDKTAKEFINRMRNHCTYLLEEETLPKNSIILCRFNLLNELNKITVNGEGFALNTYKDKKKVIDELFLKKNEVKENDFKEWLINNQYYKTGEIKLKGFQSDGKFASSLKIERKMREIFGDRFEGNIEMIEEIIKDLTIYDNDEILGRVFNSYGLSNEEIKKLLKIKLTGYGRFSNKLINGIISSSLGNKYPAKTMYEIMEETNMNFMQVLNERTFGFIDQINDLNGNKINENISYSDVENLQASPAVKKGIWQSLLVVKDIIKYMKHDPKRICIEFAREEGKKVRTVSRYNRLEKIYKEYFDGSNIQKELQTSKDKVNINDRLYLYFMQQGKSLYSDEPLYINQLETYEVDHILPRSYIVDNSLENLALVLSKENQNKTDSLLLPGDIINKMQNRWKQLFDMGLIGVKKYNNLIRTKVNEVDKEKFVARQLVETRQICVHVNELLKAYFPKTEIVDVHAGLSSDFREKYNLYKIRNINNTHHAHDAYLSALIGNFIYKKYPTVLLQNRNFYKEIEEDVDICIKEEKKKKNIYNFVVNQLSDEVVVHPKTGEILWEGRKQIEYIKKIFNTKKYFFNYATYKYDGKLFNNTIEGKNSKNISVEIKKGLDLNKYGGYSIVKNSHMVAIQYTNKKKLKREIVSIPIIYKNNIKEYLIKEYKDSNVEIIKELPLNTLIISKGCYYLLRSAKEWKISHPIYLSTKSQETLNKIKNKIETNDIKELFYEIIEKMSLIPEFMSGLKKVEKDSFEKLSKEEQCLTIEQLLKIIATPGSKLDIGKKTISERFGRIKRETTKLDEIEIVYTSPSGIYRTITKL